MANIDRNNMTDFKRNVGENIRRLRLKKDVEVKKICSDLGISAPAYSNIERGITDINVTRIMQLADYFSVHHNEIMLENDTEHIHCVKQKKIDEHVEQMAIGEIDNYALALKLAREEIDYLKTQNNKLLDMLNK